MSSLELSLPARVVRVDPKWTIDEAITAERVRRLALKKNHRPYRYWRERGDDQPTPREHWCDHCVGYFGVPHDYSHENDLCRNMGWHADCRQCACIDCVVWEAWSFARRKAKA